MICLPYNTKRVLYDSENKPVAVYFNPETDRFEVLEGNLGGPYYTHRGTVAMEAWEGNGSETKTFSSPRYGFAISNDGTADLTFVINGQTRKVMPGEAYSALFEPFTNVTINASSAYRAEVLK